MRISKWVYRGVIIAVIAHLYFLMADYVLNVRNQPEITQNKAPGKVFKDSYKGIEVLAQF